MNRDEVQEMINNTLTRVFADDSIIIQHLKNIIYQELAETIKEAGAIDVYNFQSIESQCTAHAAREFGDRIGYLVNDV